MGLREVLQGMIRSFFVIFSCAVLAIYLFVMLFLKEGIHVNDITGALVLTILANLAYFILYSKKELSKKQIFLRNIIHFVVVATIIMLGANFLGWLSPRNPGKSIFFVCVFIFIYTLVTVIEFRQLKKLANQLNQKLQERYKE